MSYKKLYQGQRGFTFCPDGITIVPRASIEVLPQCPNEIRDKIQFAAAKGWLQIVAHMPDEEYTWELLSK